MNTIKASEDKYLTQVNIEDESNRIFVVELSGYGIVADDWREADQAEKDEWESKYNQPLEEEI